MYACLCNPVSNEAELKIQNDFSSGRRVELYESTRDRCREDCLLTN